MAGVQTIEDWWNRFANSTMPALSPEEVLVGRADEASELLRSFELDPHALVVSASSQDDVIAFVAAVLLTSPEEGRADLLARALVVRDAYSLTLLDAAVNLLILVPFDNELRREALLVRSHHVVLMGDEDGPADIRLPPIPIGPFKSLLLAEHVEEDKATVLAQAANRSLVAFQREAPARPGIARRDWSGLLTSKSVRRAWLAGSWTELRSGDIDALTLLLGIPYDDVRDELLTATRGPDPLFIVEGQQWARVLPEAALFYSHGSLSASDLEATERTIQSVLGAVNPALELPIEDRWKAGLHGKTRIHSSTLRDGLAVTLALLGAQGSQILLGAGRTAQRWAETVVFDLLRRANEDAAGQLWASLSDVLPLIAEAAPDVFLRAIEEGVRPNDPLLAKMFLDQVGADAFSVSSPHTGLLWALEGLAWSPEHLGLAAEVLARLAEIDPGGRLSNRPRATLASIFRTWLPQTAASAESRLRVIDAICSRHNEVGWTLLLDLLPEYQAVGDYTHAPRFRRWKPKSQAVSRLEYWELSATIARRAIELADADSARWVHLIDRLRDLPPAERGTALDMLSVLADNGSFGDSDRTAVWEAIERLVRKHRAFADAEWAMRTEDVTRLSEISERFKPDDPVAASAWLFMSYVPQLEEGKRSKLYDYEKTLREKRENAVRAIVGHSGTSGLLRAAQVAEAPWAVGHAAMTSGVAVDEPSILDLLDSREPKEVECALGFASARIAADGWQWIDRALGVFAGRPLAQARILRMADDLPKAWSRTASLGREVTDAYWAEFIPYGRGSDFALVNESVQQLIAHGRVAIAIDTLAMYSHDEASQVDPELAARALEALVELEAKDPEIQLISNYDLESLLAYVRTRIDEDRAGLLEWRLLPALGPFAASPTLHRRLSRDPAFFVEILSLSFRPSSGEVDQEIPPAVATNAWHLLHEWKIVPGSNADGDIEDVALSAWLENARDLAREVDRLEVADVSIGQVFAYSKGDMDGTWPTLPVRNAIERLASTRLEDGFRTGIYNKRGAWSRSLTEGGKQERELAAKYREEAGMLQEGWPRTAAVLRGLADGYESEARMHDEQSERLSKGMDV